MLFYTSCKGLSGDSLEEVVQVQNIESLTNEEENKIFTKLANLTEDPEDWALYVKDKNSTMKFVKSDNGSYLSGPNGAKIYAKLAIDSKLGESDMDLFTAFLGNNTSVSVEKENSAELYNKLVKERQRLLKSANERNPIIISLDEQLNSLEKSITQESDVVPFSKVDQVPVFPGCEDADNKRKCFNERMHRHISKNFNYPKEAQEKGIQGRVNIMLTINQEGSVSNIRRRGPDKLLEDEAERILKRLPKMEPGKHKGKIVNVPYSIPISFKLKENKDETTSFKFSEITGEKPLIIFDGKEFKGDINKVSPNDILEMHVLKECMY